MFANKPTHVHQLLTSQQLQAEMSTRNLPGGKKRPAHRAENLAAICEPNV
jgi:hypothetical protein